MRYFDLPTVLCRDGGTGRRSGLIIRRAEYDLARELQALRNSRIPHADGWQELSKVAPLKCNSPECAAVGEPRTGDHQADPNHNGTGGPWVKPFYGLIVMLA